MNSRPRIAVADKRAGTTPHNFILEAIAEKADLAERRADFDAVAVAVAEARYSSIFASGMNIAWDDMRTYLVSRLAGKPARRPVARKLTR